jgi:SAM-dependent methyltransferase
MPSLFRRILRSPQLHFARNFYIKHYLVPRFHRRFQAMPLRDIFSTIYRERLWNSEHPEPFDSGPGSSPSFAAPYCQRITRFIRDNHITSLLDIGCGDFRIGRQLAATGIHYTGVDIVPELITHLRENHAGPRVQFECIDATSEPLPPADLVVIREVLQHLTNAQIHSVLRQLEHYPHVIVTESVPTSPHAVPNLDKVQGPDVRLYANSGVFLDQPPFNLRTEELLRLPHGPTATLVTSRISFPRAHPS